MRNVRTERYAFVAGLGPPVRLYMTFIRALYVVVFKGSN